MKKMFTTIMIFFVASTIFAEQKHIKEGIDAYATQANTQNGSTDRSGTISADITGNVLTITFNDNVGIAHIVIKDSNGVYIDNDNVVSTPECATFTINDGHIRHNCINAFEASDGSIIMMEECCDTITDYSGEYTESVNLLKINPQGVLVDLTKVVFSATSQNSPFLRVPSENNSNVMGGLYLNESNELRYTAIFFDDNLSITNNIDVAFPVDGLMITDGFTTTYKSIVDSNGDLILMSMKNDSDDTYVFVKMSVYGEIKAIKYSVSENYKDCYLTERSLYIHSNNPLEYRCHFTKGSSSEILTVILDENFEILNLVDIDEYEENGEIYVFDCSESEIMCLKDGSILMSSIVRDKAGWNDEISECVQLTKFNKEYEIIAYT